MFVNDVKEKEPLPQSVEVLSHVAARAATFLVFAVTWTAFKWLRIVPRLALSILYSHAGCFLIVPMTQAILLRFNLTQLCGLRPTRKNCLVAMHFNLMQSRRLLHSPSKKRLLSARFQSYAVTRAATIFTEFIRWDILISILCSPHGLLHSADVLPLPVGPFQSYAAA